MLFVDEPTTGLDPSGRREVWAAIRSRVSAGTTVLLTTQYLKRPINCAIVSPCWKAGRVIAEGTPEELKSALGGDWIDIVLTPGADTGPVAKLLQQVASGELRIDVESNRISVPVADRTRSLVILAAALLEARIEPEDISLRRPTLDEVFLHLTGLTEAEQPKEVVL